jgi:hypothetical protein
MKELSPQAQAVVDAFLGDCENTGLQMDDLRGNVAAALRAAANQTACRIFLGLDVINADDLHDIAAELEAPQ